MGFMAKGNPNWGRDKLIDWSFRVRGKNARGDMVTLGKYEKESEARARYDELASEGIYDHLRVQRLSPKSAKS